jgi:DsbC/DsbD-like thiol-disulfide interchange protein
MTRSIYLLLSCIVLAFIGAACSNTNPNSASTPPDAPAASPTTKRITSEGVVKVLAQRVEIPAGRSGEATVSVTIEQGYHVNANPPTFPYLKATTLELKAAEGLTVGSIVYPKATDKKFPFADKPLAVYEGETDLKVVIKTDKTAKKGERSIPASLRIQACDDQVCYPPGTLELAIPVNIN